MSRVRLLLWRHGQTDWNAGGRFQGQLDVPLNDVGRAQAEKAAPFLACAEPDRIVSSDLTRARQTAGVLADMTGLALETDVRLREINTGTWSGLTMDEVHALDADFGVAIKEGRDYRRSPTGETIEETGQRCAAALRDIAGAAEDGQTIVVVGHGLALRVGLAHLIGLDHRQSWALGGIHNCAVSELLHRPDSLAPYARWALVSYNVSYGGPPTGRAEP